MQGVDTRERGKNNFIYFAPAGVKGVDARERPRATDFDLFCVVRGAK